MHTVQIPLTKSNNLSKLNSWIKPKTPYLSQNLRGPTHKIRLAHSQRRKKTRVHYNQLTIQTAIMDRNDDESSEIRGLLSLFAYSDFPTSRPILLVFLVYLYHVQKIPHQNTLWKTLWEKSGKKNAWCGPLSMAPCARTGLWISWQGAAHKTGGAEHFPVSSFSSFFCMHLGLRTLNAILLNSLGPLLRLQSTKTSILAPKLLKSSETSPITKSHVISTKH